MKQVILRCPKCRDKFKYDVSDGWPDNCPLCKTDINNRVPDDVIVCPAFLSPQTRNNDAVARQVMDGSETRMHLAAAAAGVPSSEMAGLKITDISDRRDTQVSEAPVNNPVSQQMAAMQARGMPVGFGAPADTSAASSGAINVNGQVIQGIAPRAGMSGLLKAQANIARSVPRDPSMTKYG